MGYGRASVPLKSGGQLGGRPPGFRSSLDTLQLVLSTKLHIRVCGGVGGLNGLSHEDAKTVLQCME